MSWLAVVSFSHIANNTKKISSRGVPSYVGSFLDYIVPNSNNMEGGLGKPLPTFPPYLPVTEAYGEGGSWPVFCPVVQ